MLIIRIKRNFTANSIGFLINMFLTLILVPVFLNNWGSEFYGEWLLLTSIVSYLSLSDLGFNTVTSNQFGIAYSSGDIKMCQNLIYNNLIVIGVLTIFIFFLARILFLFF